MEKTISVQIPTRSISDGSSAAMPLVLGFALGMLLPVIALVIFKSLDRLMVLNLENGIVSVHNPMIAVWMFLISCSALVLIFLGWCYVKVHEAKANADVLESELDLEKTVFSEVVSLASSPAQTPGSSVRNVSVKVATPQNVVPCNGTNQKPIEYAIEEIESSLSA